MARHKNRPRIRVVRVSHGAHRAWSSNRVSDLGVRADLAEGNVLERAPNIVLEIRRRNGRAQYVKGSSSAFEEFVELARGVGDAARWRAGAFVTGLVGKINRVYTLLVTFDAPVANG